MSQRSCSSLCVLNIGRNAVGGETVRALQRDGALRSLASLGLQAAALGPDAAAPLALLLRTSGHALQVLNPTPSTPSVAPPYNTPSHTPRYITLPHAPLPGSSFQHPLSITTLIPRSSLQHPLPRSPYSTPLPARPLARFPLQHPLSITILMPHSPLQHLLRRSPTALPPSLSLPPRSLAWTPFRLPTLQYYTHIPLSLTTPRAWLPLLHPLPHRPSAAPFYSTLSRTPRSSFLILQCLHLKCRQP